MGVDLALAYEREFEKVRERQRKAAEKRRKKQALSEEHSFDPFDYGLSVKRDETSQYTKAFDVLKDKFGEATVLSWEPDVLERALNETILKEFAPSGDGISEKSLNFARNLMGGFDFSPVGINFDGPSFVEQMAQNRQLRTQTHILWKANLRRKR